MAGNYKYITYNTKTQSFVATKKRPGNQSKAPVLARIRKRLISDIKKFNSQYKLQRTSVQQLFVEITDKHGKFKSGKGLGKSKIDIVHTIAIATIIDCFVNLLNNPEDTEQLATSMSFVSGILSSDDEDGRTDYFDFLTTLKKLLETEEGRATVLTQANAFVEYWNRASRNLCGGHMSTNRSIGKHLDPQLRRTRGGRLTYAPYTQNLTTTISKWRGTTYSTAFNNDEEPISSSAGLNKASAGYDITHIPLRRKRTSAYLRQYAIENYHVCYIESFRIKNLKLSHIKKLDSYCKFTATVKDIYENFDDEDIEMELDELQQSLLGLCIDADKHLPCHDWDDDAEENFMLEDASYDDPEFEELPAEFFNATPIVITYKHYTTLFNTSMTITDANFDDALSYVRTQYANGADPYEMQTFEKLCYFAENKSWAREALAPLQIELIHAEEQHDDNPSIIYTASHHAW